MKAIIKIFAIIIAATVASWLIYHSTTLDYYYKKAHYSANFFEQADILTLPMFVDALSIDGISAWRSWNFSRAPYFVPDLLFHFLARLLSFGDREAEFIAFASLQITALLLALLALINVLIPNGASRWLVFTVFGLSLFASARELPVIWVSSFHTGAAILGIALLAVFWKLAFASRLRLILLLALTAVGAVSDPLLIPQFLMPFAAAVAVSFPQRNDRAQAIAITMLMLAASIAAIFLMSLLGPARQAIPLDQSLADRLHAIQQVTADMLFMNPSVSSQMLRAAVLMCALSWIVPTWRRKIREEAELRVLVTWTLFAVPAHLAISFMYPDLGNYEEVLDMRHRIPMYLVPAIAGCGAACKLISHKITMSTAALTIAAVLIATLLNDRYLPTVTSREPEGISCFLQNTLKHEMGVSVWWTARQLAYWTKGERTLGQILGGRLVMMLNRSLPEGAGFHYFVSDLSKSAFPDRSAWYDSGAMWIKQHGQPVQSVRCGVLNIMRASGVFTQGF